MDKGGQDERTIVVDASVAAKWIIPGEPWGDNAGKLKESIVSGKVVAYAPPLFSYELASVILRSINTGVLTFEDGVESLNAIKLLGINIQPTLWNHIVEMLDIALTTKLTIYDSAYLHLSKRLGAKLITADEELKRKGERVAEVCLLKDFI